LEQRVAERTRELEMLARTDVLTGLSNRRHIEEIARQELDRRLRYGGSLAFGLVDADHFHDINTRYTHPGGDAVLRGLAQTLASSLRAVDRVGRYGGEESLVVAPETNLEGAQSLAERIRSTAEKSQTSYHGQPIPVTVSVGFAVADANEPADYDCMVN